MSSRERQLEIRIESLEQKLAEAYLTIKGLRKSTNISDQLYNQICGDANGKVMSRHPDGVVELQNIRVII